MRRSPEGESLAAMKALLRDLQTAKLIYPDDLSVLSLKRQLKAKITELEKRQRDADTARRSRNGRRFSAELYIHPEDQNQQHNNC